MSGETATTSINATLGHYLAAAESLHPARWVVMLTGKCWHPARALLRKLHARDEYYRRRARRSFAEFLRYTKPDYQLSWFHEELALERDRFLADVLALRSPRLIINVPPQEGKSEQVRAAFRTSAHGKEATIGLVGAGEFLGRTA